MIARAALPALLLAACGVAGRPLPPGPLPPGAPGAPHPRSAPEALEVTVPAPSVDIDGRSLGEGVEVLLFVDRRACTGIPDARAPAGRPLRVPRPAGVVTLRAVAAVAGRAGPPGPAVTARWQAPPPPPEAPLAFVGQGGVELSWLPPENASHVRILRDGLAVAEVPAAAALHTDPAPPGEHAYTLEALADTWVSGPSATATVVVP